MQLVPVKQLDHVERFLRSFTSENTRLAYERDLKDYAVFAASADPMAFSTLAQYRDVLVASSAPATVVRKFSSVKSFLSFLASEGSIQQNPALNMRVPRSRTLEHTEAFDDVEVGQVLAEVDCKTFSGNSHRIALVLLFNLGLRRSELVNLRVRSFGEHRGTRFLTIEGKGGKQRLVPLTSKVAGELDEYLVRYCALTGESLLESDFLLQSGPGSKNERPMNPSTIYRLVRQYAQDAGVTKRVSPHSCRATMISHLLEKNVSPRSVADLVGHSSINTTVGTYDKKRDALSNPAASKVTF